MSLHPGIGLRQFIPCTRQVRCTRGRQCRTRFPMACWLVTEPYSCIRRLGTRSRHWDGRCCRSLPRSLRRHRSEQPCNHRVFVAGLVCLLPLVAPHSVAQRKSVSYTGFSGLGNRMPPCIRDDRQEHRQNRQSRQRPSHPNRNHFRCADYRGCSRFRMGSTRRMR